MRIEFDMEVEGPEYHQQQVFVRVEIVAHELVPRWLLLRLVRGVDEHASLARDARVSEYIVCA
jgi:hypothetical protein